MPNVPKKIIIIDSHALIHRSYHALPPLVNKKGQIVNAVYGFSSVLLKVIKEINPDYILATFDLEAKTFRHFAYEAYKAQRKKADDELYQQIPLVKQMLDAFNIPCFEKEGYEADDAIGTIVKKVTQLNDKGKFEVIIVTGDLDTLQLVNPNTKIYTLKKGVTETVIYGEKEIWNKYTLKPSQIIDFKGLKGDPSDNIPGVPGVGEKTAINLINMFGSVENLYKEIEKVKLEEKQNKVEIKKLKISKKIFENLKEFKDQAFFSKELATINCDVPLNFDLEKLKYVKDFDRKAVINFFKEMDFNSLINRVEHIDEKHEKILSSKESKIGDKLDKNSRYGNMMNEIEQSYKDGIFSNRIYDLEKELVPVIRTIEANGIKIDVGYLENLSKVLSNRINKLEKDIFKLVGEEINLNSPAQLSKLLFEGLKISVRGLRKTPKGDIISTNAKELLKLKTVHPVINLVLEFRELSKLKSTYTDSLTKIINRKTGRIHTRFNPLGAVTGRISSSKPNLQNIPIKTELGNEIRKSFVAEDGYKLVSADYSQIELRIIAALANDTNMIKAFSEGKDIHSLTASKINRVSLDKVTPQMRSLAKALNFGITYGMGVNGFAESAGITRQEAKEFIDKYRNDFPDITRYIELLKQMAYDKGYARTLLGRKRFLPELKSRNFHLRRAAERMAINMPIQGTAADIMKIAMVKVERYIDDLENTGGASGKVKLLLQVHDELVLEVEKDFCEEAAARVKKIMEEAYDFPGLLKAGISMGDNWGEMKKQYKNLII